MTALDTAAIRARHPLRHFEGTDYCDNCGAVWPCDAIVALDWGEQMQRERDSARDLAVSLEQRVAEFTEAAKESLYAHDDACGACDDLRAALATPAEPTP